MQDRGFWSKQAFYLQEFWPFILFEILLGFVVIFLLITYGPGVYRGVVGPEPTPTATPSHPAICGDAVCYVGAENAGTCPKDCGPLPTPTSVPNVVLQATTSTALPITSPEATATP